MSIYSDYSRARIGWFFGLSGPQLALVSLTVLPVAAAVSRQAWPTAGLLAGLWVVLVAVTVTPVRGRSATGWAVTMVRFAFGALSGWTRFRARATTGRATPLDTVDLPGALAGVQIHEGPPHGPTHTRVAIIQNHAEATWALTARIVHPGLGLCETQDRDAYGHGLAQLLDLATRTELVSEVILMVRTVGEDGAERHEWITRHRAPDGPPAARAVNDDVHAAVTSASVRTEAYLTVVVPESRLGKAARESGGGLTGRARVLYGTATELEAHARSGLGATSVDWLTSPALAVACRTGFAPGDRAGIIAALADQHSDVSVNADVPWAMAGPSGADPAPRHYSHDAWNSISATIKLPVKGAAMGALAPVLTTRHAGERRCLMVCFPVVAPGRAGRQSASSEWAADLGETLRSKARVKQSTTTGDETAKVRRIESKLARGAALTHPYAVVTVTVPKTTRVAEAGRALDASIRRAGFAPLRLDLAHDAAFAASVIPLGTGLHRKIA